MSDHTEDNKPYKIAFNGNEYQAREVYVKEKDTFIIVAEMRLATAISKSAFLVEAVKVNKEVDWFLDEDDFKLSDEEICKIVFKK